MLWTTRLSLQGREDVWDPSLQPTLMWCVENTRVEFFQEMDLRQGKISARFASFTHPKTSKVLDAIYLLVFAEKQLAPFFCPPLEAEFHLRLADQPARIIKEERYLLVRCVGDAQAPGFLAIHQLAVQGRQGVVLALERHE